MIINQNIMSLSVSSLKKVKITFKTFLPFFEMNIAPFFVDVHKIRLILDIMTRKKLSKKHQRNQLANVYMLSFKQLNKNSFLRLLKCI